MVGLGFPSAKTKVQKVVGVIVLCLLLGFIIYVVIKSTIFGSF